MTKKVKLSLLFLCIIFGLSGTLAGYLWIINSGETEEPYTTVMSDFEEELVENNDPIILSTTTIIYQLYDTTSGITEQIINKAPSFLVNKTEEYLVQAFTEWEIISFTEEQVIMERTFSSLPLVAYTLSSDGEFLTIYQGPKSAGNILELTTIPVNHLPQQEQVRLTQGISVSDRNELIRRLEDFSS